MCTKDFTGNMIIFALNETFFCECNNHTLWSIGTIEYGIKNKQQAGLVSLNDCNRQIIQKDSDLTKLSSSLVQ